MTAEAAAAVPLLAESPAAGLIPALPAAGFRVSYIAFVRASATSSQKEISIIKAALNNSAYSSR